MGKQQQQESTVETQQAPQGAGGEQAVEQGSGPRARLIAMLGSQNPDPMQVAELFMAMNVRNRIAIYDDDALSDQLYAATKGDAAADQMVSDAIIAARQTQRGNVKDAVAGDSSIMAMLEEEMGKFAESYDEEIQVWLSDYSQKAAEDSEYEPPEEKSLWRGDGEWVRSVYPDESVLKAFGGNAAEQGRLLVYLDFNGMYLHVEDFSPGYVWTSMTARGVSGLAHARLETPDGQGDRQSVYFPMYAPGSTVRHFGGDTVQGMAPVEGQVELQ